MKKKLLAFIAAITAEEKKKKSSRPSWMGGTSSQINPVPTPPPSTYHLNFNGVNDKIVVPHAASINNLPLGDFTAEWSGSVTINDNGYLFSKSDPLGFTGWDMYVFESAVSPGTWVLFFGITSDGFSFYKYVSFSIPDANNHHYEMTWNASTATPKLFVDGVAASIVDNDDGGYSSGTYDSDNGINLYIGGHTSDTLDYFLHGRCNWMRISNTLRHSSNFTPPSLTICPPNDANTVLRFALEEGAGIIANDTSGNNNNGTITGATWQAD